MDQHAAHVEWQLSITRSGQPNIGCHVSLPHQSSQTAGRGGQRSDEVHAHYIGRQAWCCCCANNWPPAWRDTGIHGQRSQHCAEEWQCLQHRVQREGDEKQQAVHKGTQELARLETHIADAQTKLAALQEQIELEQEATAAIFATSTRENELDRFGIFATSEGLAEGLEELVVDIEAIHRMDPEARKFALLHLAARFGQLQELSRHMRRLVAEATSCYDTLDLSDTLDRVQQVAAGLLESTEVRLGHGCGHFGRLCGLSAVQDTALSAGCALSERTSTC